MKLPALILASLALFACSPPPAAAPPSHLTFVDLTDDFARIHDRDASLPDRERVSRFKSEFATILRGYYDAERVGAPPERYDAYLLRGIRRFPAQRTGIERVSREFGTLIGPALRGFEREFGPMTGYPPIYLVNSLNEFDGGTRELPDGVRLMFGADMIDKLYRDKPIQPFFQHELFHLMHSRTFTECEQIWCSLWMEGLAVYASAKLNPGADDEALLLNVPVPLRPAVEADREQAICAVESRLQSTSKDDYGPLFNANGKGIGKLPGRFGYYVGLLVAQDLARTRSLKSLAALSNVQARPLVEASLRSMASC